jgi:hypothetical protein
MIALAPRALKFSELCGFFDKQWLATRIADTHPYTLYGGTRGPGKSYWLRWYCLRRLLKWAAEGHKNVRVGLFCEDYPSLVERQINKINSEFPKWLGSLKETRTDGLCFFLKPEYGSGKIALRNLDDPSKFQSAEFAGMAIDEITKNKEKTKSGNLFFDELRGSLRWAGITDSFFVAASNPNGPGQKWVRAHFIEHRLSDALKGHEHEFAFVPGEPGDNPHLAQAYWDMLNTLDGKLHEAWVEGNWYVSFEGVVYEEFASDNLTDDEPDFDSPFELAFDDGYIDPRVILFVQRTGRGILVFDEIFESKKLDEQSVKRVLAKCAAYAGFDGSTPEQSLPEEWGTLTLEEASQWCSQPRSTEDKRPRVLLPEIAIGSSEAKQLMRRFQLANIPARGGTHEVVEGVKLVRRLIKDAQGVRSLQVHRTRCPNLIRELTTDYQYPPEGSRGDDEKPMDGNDHASDALRYWCWMRARG